MLTHGNGPQVGNELLRQERAADEVPRCRSTSPSRRRRPRSGSVVSELAVARAAGACVLTHVVVDESDPAFASPTKPIGPFYDELARARAGAGARLGARARTPAAAGAAPCLRRSRSRWSSSTSIRALCDARNDLAIACGGGGIPVVRRDGRLEGIEAVIDKDRASSLLAVALAAERLVILTDVPAVMRGLRHARAEAACAQLDAARGRGARRRRCRRGRCGRSSRPRSPSSERPAARQLITSAESLEEALEGRAGTHIRA